MRLGLNLDDPQRVTRQGLSMTYAAVKCCSHGQLRRAVVNRANPSLHFCREAGCSEPNDAWHIPEFAVLDSEIFLDVNQYARRTTCGFIWQLLKGALWWVVWALWLPFRGLGLVG